MTNEQMVENGFPWRDATIAIVGLGLMGGSLALALRARNLCARLIAVECDAATRAHALARHIVEQASDDLALIRQADVVVLATPPRVIVELVPRIGGLVKKNAVVFDLGSTKRAIVEAMEKLPTHVQVIGAHPMCGKETAGLDAADARLFQNALFILTPLARTPVDLITHLTSFVTRLDARPVLLDAERHDRIVAAISHLPFAVACALMLTADAHARDDASVFTLAASGFRDTSRLAASNTAMMLDILLLNRDNVTRCLRDYAHHLKVLANALERGDESELHTLMQHAAEQRRALFQNPPSTSEDPK